MMSEVFVNIKTVLQNHCTECLYWLNFFFWVYFGGLYCKQYEPRSDSSLSVCFRDNISLEFIWIYAADV